MPRSPSPSSLAVTAEMAQQLFRKIEAESAKHPGTTDAANLLGNKPLNRWHNVLPYDHSRVKLEFNKALFRTDYINASYVRIPVATAAAAPPRASPAAASSEGIQCPPVYVLTQGPLPETVAHFWSMVWQLKSRAVVMLCRNVEYQIPKCAYYAPTSSTSVMDVGAGLELSLVWERRHESADAAVRRYKLTYTPTMETREVTQFHFLTWPDFGVPSQPDAFLKFVRIVNKEHLSVEGSPNVIHCSAGIGRSGTYCLVDCCLKQMAQTKVPVTKKDVVLRLLDMRKQRKGLVQTPDQLQFALQAIAAGMAGCLLGDEASSTSDTTSSSSAESNRGQIGEKALKSINESGQQQQPADEKDSSEARGPCFFRGAPLSGHHQNGVASSSSPTSPATTQRVPSSSSSSSPGGKLDDGLLQRNRKRSTEAGKAGCDEGQHDCANYAESALSAASSAAAESNGKTDEDDDVDEECSCQNEKAAGRTTDFANLPKRKKSENDC